VSAGACAWNATGACPGEPVTSEISPPPAIERGAIHLSQLYDVSYSIDLDRARETLATPSARVRPVVSRGGNIEIPQLPLEVRLEDAEMTIGETHYNARLHARIYDLGILALRLSLALPRNCSWDDVTAQMSDVQGAQEQTLTVFEERLRGLRAALDVAIERPNAHVLTEDYLLLVVERLAGEIPAARLAEHPALLQAALCERKKLSASARSLATPLSYYEDDLILLTWSAAIMIEPDADAREDAALLLEFANTQLLALRSYDEEVERELARLTPHLAPHKPRWSSLLWTRLTASSNVQREVATLITDINETNARVENALKVTEDVYWNRVYVAAVRTLRIEAWRSSLAESLNILQQRASLLRDEAQESLGILLEALVIILIAVELIVAVIGLRAGTH
jgi:hypothetical protein